MTASAAEILQAGVTLEPQEAVAIAQQLIASILSGHGAGVAGPPFGPPTLDRVMLNDDGSVVCRGCETTPTVSEIAILLQSLLPAAPGRMPGGLRYTIARAMLDVDVPPFDSIDEFSETLARYERGPRDQIVMRVLRRGAATRGLVPAVLAERRRSIQTTELRRALREAEMELYRYRVLTAAPTTVALSPAALDAVVVSPRGARGPRIVSGLAGLAAGMLLMAGGGFAYRHRGAAPPPPPAPVIVEHLSTPAPLSPARPGDVTVQTVVERQSPSRTEPRHPSGRATPARTTSSVRPAARARTHQGPRVYPEPRPRHPGRDGVLDRLKLRWLRDVFAKAETD